MTLCSIELAAGRDLAVGAAPFVVGVVLVALLIALVWRGQRRRARVPRPEEQPRLPESGPVGEIIERREPDEVPRDVPRSTPHRLPGFGNSGTRPSGAQQDASTDDRSRGGGRPQE
ncbi:DUF6479 family protein [Streptomyces sp. TLI_146]|uniref:DUF6479 family protein n=1 Tax=Streptomyces sp. TLI_146 TaxID=1938858 RepID=UPI000C70B826|nr:DUF6479 family protein [Streptomyces sp. TLI_146]PKV82889.1 hypothetical protein BX283_0354 [Streptomyces sp. TLI_146]